jgi:Flp pilus assembly protein TadB
LRGYYPGEREYRERPQPRIRRPKLDQPLPRVPRPRNERPRVARPRIERRERAAGRSRRLDWIVGIVLGIVLGIAVVTAFLVFGSEDTIDSPSVTGGESAQPAREAPAPAPTNE